MNKYLSIYLYCLVQDDARMCHLLALVFAHLANFWTNVFSNRTISPQVDLYEVSVYQNWYFVLMIPMIYSGVAFFVFFYCLGLQINQMNANRPTCQCYRPHTQVIFGDEKFSDFLTNSNLNRTHIAIFALIPCHGIFPGKARVVPDESWMKSSLKW